MQEGFSDEAKRLKAIFETVVDGILTIDERGRIETVNPAACRMFGYDSAELLGRGVQVLMQEPEKSEHDTYVSRYLETGVRKIIGIGREVTARRKDGSTFPVHLSVSEFEKGDKIYFTGVLRDISKEKQAEEELRQLNQALEKRVEERTQQLRESLEAQQQSNKDLQQTRKELEYALAKERQLNELKSRFVTLASHEFRTPLTTILSSAVLLSRYIGDEAGETSERQLKHITRIRTSVSNLTNILEEFLSISRLEEGKVSLRITDFSLKALTEEVIEELSTLKRKGQELLLDLQNEGGDEIRTDRKILKNITLNLISNAIKYSNEEGRIWCTFAVKKNMLSLTVKDEGIGISKEDQVHLFERFYRGENVMNIQGTGLGLNIVKKYLDLLSGEIKYESEYGKGSTFSVKIPINSEE